MFSDGFSEGKITDINKGFPSDSVPYTEYYEYSSDSDLEDESPCYAEGGDDENLSKPQDLDSQVPSIAASESGDVQVEHEHDHQSALNSVGPSELSR